MKKILIAITILTISTTVAWAQQGSVGMSWSADPSATMHTVFISPTSSKPYLDSVSTAWRKDSIALDFTKLKYKAGKLTAVKGSVKVMTKGSNMSGSFSNSNLKKGIDIRIDNKNVSIKGE